MTMNSIFSPLWRPSTGPVLPWVHTLDKIMGTCDLPSLDGPLIYIASDYSGTQRQSDYLVLSFLIADLYNSGGWEKQRRVVRRRFLRDRRRMSYKALNDRWRVAALDPFLEAAALINGLLCCFVIHKSIERIVTGPDTFQQWAGRLGIKGKWTEKQFESMLRVANFVSIFIGAMGKDAQSMYWISDEDDIFANPTKQADVATMMSWLGNLYIRHHPGELGVGTTAIDPGDRAEEDIVSVADLVAGALADAVTKISKHPKWFTSRITIVPSGLKPKTERIVSWLATRKPHLKYVSIVFDRSDQSDYSMRRMEWRPSRIVI